jgi:hypothetical protein
MKDVVKMFDAFVDSAIKGKVGPSRESVKAEIERLQRVRDMFVKLAEMSLVSGKAHMENNKQIMSILEELK